MAEISQSNDVYTVVVEFTTQPENQDEVAKTLLENSGVFPSQPGFVSQHFHKSHDGTQVLVYVQWKSEQDHLNCFHSPQVANQASAVQGLVERGVVQMNVQTFDVVQSDEAAS